MAIIRGVSVDAQLLPNATGTLYTPPTGVTRAIITAANMYANAATTGTELYILPSGGSASDTTKVKHKDFAADEDDAAPQIVGQSIESGGELQGNDGGNGGTGVNITLTLTEFTGDS